MDIKFKIFAFVIFVLFLTASGLPSITSKYKRDCDSLEVLKLYSLFSEYHKNKDYNSALPFGWQVISCNPTKFAKWIYYKMEDCQWYIHDSSNVVPVIQTMEDSIFQFYDLAIQYYPADKAYFQVRKAFVGETWLQLEPATVIGEYEKAVSDNSELSSYYLDRLGQLYIHNSLENNNGTKAIDLYSRLAEREPDNPKWFDILSNLVGDVGKLLDIRKRSWEADNENLSKAWAYASECMRNSEYIRAIEPLEFLTQKAPETINYWSQLAFAYHKTEQLSKAERAYNNLIGLEPDNKDLYFNLGLVYKDQGKLSKSRQFLEKASDLAGGWGMAIFSIGLLYEQSARDCTFDFDTKKVYQLAQDTYRRAYNMDQTLTQARDRISALSSSIPTREEWFFRGNKSGEVIPITGTCFGWIGKSITVPLSK